MQDGSAVCRFDVAVPETLMQGQWKICLVPDVFLVGTAGTPLDSIRLEKMVLKGKSYQDYRKGLYDAFLKESKEIADSNRFRGGNAYRIFVERNMPKIYPLRFDATHVWTRQDSLRQDEGMKNGYGVSEDEVIRRYGNLRALQDLRRRKAALVPVADPSLPEEGACVDTVMDAPSAFVKGYDGRIAVQPGYAKAVVTLTGVLYDGNDRPVRHLAPAGPVEFVFASVVDLARPLERTIAKTIYRKVDMNTSFDIRFGAGKAKVDTTLADNAREVESILKTIVEVFSNKEYEVNSISVTANCSPEGSWRANENLSRKRSQAVSDYISPIVKVIADTLGVKDKARFRSQSVAENWETLSRLIASDTVLTDDQKAAYSRKIAVVANPDAREKRLSREPYYRYVRDHLYPKLRTVNFNFHLTRVGMKKDALTVYEKDTTYTRGVNLLMAKDYEAALEILKNYPDDYNLAVCYAALGRDEEAANVLVPLEHLAANDYLHALVLSRLGRDEEALSLYRDACGKDEYYKERGKIDPEIFKLIK